MQGFKIPKEMPIFTIWMLWVCFTVVPILWLLAGATRYWGVTGDPWAAWVQAVGSIGAICVAFIVANRTHQIEQRAKLEEGQKLEVEALHFAENASYEAYASVAQAAFLAVSQPYELRLARLREVQITIRLLLNRPLPTYAYSSIFVIQEQVSEALALLERIKGRAKPEDPVNHLDIAELELRAEQIRAPRAILAGLYRSKASIAGIEAYIRGEDVI